MTSVVYKMLIQPKDEISKILLSCIEMSLKQFRAQIFDISQHQQQPTKYL